MIKVGIIEGWDRIEGAIVVLIRFIAFIYTIVLISKLSKPSMTSNYKMS